MPENGFSNIQNLGHVTNDVIMWSRDHSSTMVFSTKYEYVNFSHISLTVSHKNNTFRKVVTLRTNIASKWQKFTARAWSYRFKLTFHLDRI